MSKALVALLVGTGLCLLLSVLADNLLAGERGDAGGSATADYGPPAGTLPGSDGKESPLDGKEYSFPDTENQLITNFLASYREMDIEGYREVLHDDFRFYFQPFDIENHNLPSDHWRKDEELTVSENIFSGESCPEEQPGFSQITINIFVPLTPWTDSIHPDFPNVRRALYQVSMSAIRPGSTTIEVDGLADFFATSRDSVTDSGTLPYWQLIGHVDLTVGKTTESSSWGAMKLTCQGDPTPEDRPSWGRVKAIYR